MAWISLAILLVYLASYSIHWSIGRDSALYLTLGRNLAAGDGYIYADKPHTHVPPGFPAVLATIESAGGGMAAFNAAMLAMGLLGLLACYFLLRQLTARGWALVILLFLAFSQEWVQRSGELISDIPFALVFLAGLGLLYHSDNRRSKCEWLLGCLALIAACWVRVHGFPLAAAAGLGTLIACWRRNRIQAIGTPIVLLIGCGATLLLFYNFYKANVDPLGSSYLASASQIAGGRVIQMFAKNAMRYPGQLSRLLTGQRMPLAVTAIVFAIPILIGAVRRMVKRDWVGPLAIVFYLIAILPVVIRTRYLLPLMPLLVLYLVEGWQWILARTSKVQSRTADRSLVIALIVMCAMNVALVGRLIVQRRSSDYPTAQQKGDWEYLQPLAEFLADQPAGAILAPTPVGYMTGRSCPMISRGLLNAELTEAQIAELLHHWGVRYIVFDRDNKWYPLHESMYQMIAADRPSLWTLDEVEVYLVPENLGQ